VVGFGGGGGGSNQAAKGRRGWLGGNGRIHDRRLTKTIAGREKLKDEGEHVCLSLCHSCLSRWSEGRERGRENRREGIPEYTLVSWVVNGPMRGRREETMRERRFLTKKFGGSRGRRSTNDEQNDWHWQEGPYRSAVVTLPYTTA
jgi:hypothetical protein